MSAIQNLVFFTITMAIAFGFQAYRNLTVPLPKPELGKFLRKCKAAATLTHETFKVWTSFGALGVLMTTSKINLSSHSRFRIPRRWEANMNLIEKLFEDSRRQLRNWWWDSKTLKLQPIPSKWRPSNTASTRGSSKNFWNTGKTIIYQSGMNTKPFWINSHSSQPKFKGEFLLWRHQLLEKIPQIWFQVEHPFYSRKTDGNRGRQSLQADSLSECRVRELNAKPNLEYFSF